VLTGAPDRPSSDKVVSKDDLPRLTKDDYNWSRDADMMKLRVLAKNLAKNFVNTFFAEHGDRLTLNNARLGAQVRWSALQT
jgi:putative Ca2+/H+ antiporter (TMEM165/GDT1 family)